LAYLPLVESAEAEEQCLRIRTLQSAAIDLNSMGRRELFRLSEGIPFLR